MIIVQIEKVPQPVIDAAMPEHPPGSCLGVTLTPDDHAPPFRGFRKLVVYIREGMSQYKTRLTIAHELVHVMQYLTGSVLDEDHAEALDEILAASFETRPKKEKDD